MTVKTSIPLTDEQKAELDALGVLLDQRRAGPFADLEAGEAETRAMPARKRQARAAP